MSNKKAHCRSNELLVREAGLEPARPEWTLEPESSESANSTTRAAICHIRDSSYIIAPVLEFVNPFFDYFYNSTTSPVVKKYRSLRLTGSS